MNERPDTSAIYGNEDDPDYCDVWCERHGLVFTCSAIDRWSIAVAMSRVHDWCKPKRDLRPEPPEQPHSWDWATEDPAPAMEE